jgi:hypothetical protein
VILFKFVFCFELHYHSQSQRVSFDLHQYSLSYSHEGKAARSRLPFAAANVRLEVVMIDPFVRVAMRHCGTSFGSQQFTIALVYTSLRSLLLQIDQ